MEYLVGVSSRREEKQVRINIHKARKYLEGGNQVSPKSSPLLNRLVVLPVRLTVTWFLTNIMPRWTAHS